MKKLIDGAKSSIISFWHSDTFQKDIIFLVVISILAGGALSFGLAWVVDAYFGDTVSGLIGDVGEYDLILHVREDAKDEARTELERIITENFPGAKYSEAPTIAGKANFLLSLPDEFKNREVMENMGSYFATLPGGSGHTLILAPAVTVRGVQFGAKGILISRLEELSEVKFAFVTGGNVMAVLTEEADPKSVSVAAENILNEYRTIEIRIPMGYQVDDVSETGNRLVMAVQDRLHPKLVKDVTLSDEGNDTQAFLDTLVEMKRFLLGYASQVEIKLDSTAPLRVGESVVVQGASPQPLVVGENVRPDNLVIDILEIQGNTAKGIITQGDISDVAPQQLDFSQQAAGTVIAKAYRMERGTDIGPLVGETTIHNERYELMLAIDESVKLLTELDKMAQEADQTGQHLLATLDAYEETLDQISRVEETLSSVNQSLDGPLNQLSKVNIGDVVSALNTTSNSIDFLLGSMGVSPSTIGQLADVEERYNDVARQPGMEQVTDELGRVKDQVAEGAQGLDDVAKNINPVVQLLRKFQERIREFSAQVDNFGSLAQNSDQVYNLMQDIGGATTSALDAMKTVDVDALRSDLHQIISRLQSIGNLDTDLVREQMRDVRQTLPDLTDEEIGRSVRLIDRYIGGDVIPGERIQLLVDSGVSQRSIEPVIKETLGINDITVFESPVGTLEPDVRGILFSVLREVRATIAGLAAIVFTLIVLWLDHAAIVAALRKLVPGRRGSKRLSRLWYRLMPDLAGIYGGVAGGSILLGSYLVAGGAIPLVSPLYILAFGALLGLGTAFLAERISPVSETELAAGLSLGMRKTDILREIVLPEGRPGISTLVNRRKIRFR